MKKTLQRNFIFIFVLIMALVLYVNYTDSFMLNIVFKPLIVISLLLYLFANDGQKGKAISFAVGGLVFSLFGDVLLIFQDRNPLFFIGGLISFLSAHVLYILYYLRSSEAVSVKSLKAKAVFILLIITYGTVFYAFLFNHLGALKVPVLFYTLVLVSMNVFALNRYGKVNNKSFNLIMAGAVCFTLSDSLLAVNKFLMPVPLAGVWIIATYGAAQYLITQGVLNKKVLIS
ncbi:MAG: lysoplasmalogenase [Bacteroidota bacterium]